MSKFNSILLLVLALVALPGHAENLQVTGPYPWPWPWAVGCPIRWNQVQGRYTLPKVTEGETMTISLSHTTNSTMIGVHVRRRDAMGIHSDGYSRVARDERNVRIRMIPYRFGEEPYLLQIGMYLDPSYQGGAAGCLPDRVATVLTMTPLKDDNASDEYNYVLDPEAAP